MEKATSSSSNQSPSSGGSFLFSSTYVNVTPSWLLTTLAELEERMKTLALNKTRESDKGDTFAECAETYYKSRPQLLALLQDLYNGYVTLSDRYVQALAKHNHHHRKHSSQVPSIDEGFYDQEEDSRSTLVESDTESSLSYQQPPLKSSQNNDLMVFNVDNLVAELVSKNIECDVLTEELCFTEQQCSESSRKVELQKSLLEVLESERLLLLNENARLGYRVASLVEENKGLASESIFMQRRAGELTRCVLKMREDHRVFMLTRKIEDLEGQIYGLEKRNQEYYDLLTRKDQKEEQVEINMKMVKKKKKKNVMGLQDFFQIGKQFRLKKDEASVNDSNGTKVSSWWGKVKNMDLFVCGSSST